MSTLLFRSAERYRKKAEQLTPQTLPTQARTASILKIPRLSMPRFLTNSRTKSNVPSNTARTRKVEETSMMEVSTQYNLKDINAVQHITNFYPNLYSEEIDLTNESEPSSTPDTTTAATKKKELKRNTTTIYSKKKNLNNLSATSCNLNGCHKRITCKNIIYDEVAKSSASPLVPPPIPPRRSSCINQLVTFKSTPPLATVQMPHRRHRNNITHNHTNTKHFKAKDFILQQKLGEGTYGIVYKAVYQPNGRLVALKSFRTAQEENLKTIIHREISILCRLQHPNIIRMYGIMEAEKQCSLIFEYLTMDLKQYIDTLKKHEFIHPNTVRQYMYQMCSAVNYCHFNHVMHRDLKPSNLLIDTRGRIKIADFGLSRTFTMPVGAYTQEVVTIWYRAPELLLGQEKYTTAIDIWSMGCIFAEMYTKTPLFPGQSEIGQLNLIFQILTTPNDYSWPNVTLLKHYMPNFPKYTELKLAFRVPGIGAEAFDLLYRMLTYDPASRITSADILGHIFFDSLVKPIGYI